MRLGKGLVQKQHASISRSVFTKYFPSLEYQHHLTSRRMETIGAKYSRMNQVKFVEDSLGKKIYLVHSWILCCKWDLQTSFTFYLLLGATTLSLNNLSNPISITAFCMIFYPKFSGILITWFGSWFMRQSESTNSSLNLLTFFPQFHLAKFSLRVPPNIYRN